MKKLLLSSLAILLLVGCNKEQEEEKIVYDFNPESFVGTWAVDRATAEIEKQANNTYEVIINWSSSAYESSSWNYTCNFDEVESLDCTGTRIDVFANDETDATTNVIYNDGTAKFTLESEKLTWIDEKEDAGKDLLFEKVTE